MRFGSSTLTFADRSAAGRALAGELDRYADRDDVVVLALPRGGVPVAREVAVSLDAPLDVFIVRKLGVPGREELAMGAIASGGTRVLNDEVVAGLRISRATLDEVARREQAELERRAQLYRGERPPADVRRRTAIVVDDGLATGSTMLAAVRALREQQAGRIVVAVPLAPVETCERLDAEADEMVCLHVPSPFMAVGAWYDDFRQVDDEEVRRLLDGARPAGGDTADDDDEDAG